MIADIRAGKLLDGTLDGDFAYLRTQMGRREVIVNEIMKYDRHKGPGTPGYHDLGNREREWPSPCSGGNLPPPSPDVAAREQEWRGGDRHVAD